MSQGKGIIKSPRIYGNGGADSLGYTSARLEKDYALVVELDRALAVVQGQDYAVQAAKEYLYGINNRQNAKGVQGLLTFVGAPAVGKTLMGEQIAKALRLPFLRVDMSNYNEKDSVFDLFGIHPSYKAAGPGYLTSFVEEHPVCVIMLDEFEKAHPIAGNRFLQIFERGEVEDLFLKRSINFRNVIVIITTNVGKEIYDRSLSAYNLSQTPQPTIINALKSELDPQTNAPLFSEAFVSRLTSGRIILFNKLRPEVLHKIVVDEIGKYIAYYHEHYRIAVSMDRDRLADLIIFNQGESADIRTALKAVREFFERNLERMVQIKKDENNGFFNAINFTIKLDGMSEPAREVFFNTEKKRVLVACSEEQKACFRTFESEKVELVFADQAFDIKTVAELDLSAAILETQTAFCKEIFQAAVEQQEFPVYVFDRNASSKAAFYYHTDHGATGSFSEKQSGAGFEEWLSEIFKGLDLSFITQMLFRANKIVTFETSYRFDGDPHAATLAIEAIDVSQAKDAADDKHFVANRQIPNVRFEDVYGAEDAKREFNSILDFLKNYKRYRRRGLRIPRGVLLDGPPGTGKTMLAKALAGAAGLPFIQKNATEFKKGRVGEGAKSIRDLFAMASKYAPCIVFIDEVDAISKARDVGIAGDGDHEALNALLSEMDGFQENSNPVFVIAATNFEARKGSSRLDEAFLRRFDRRIHIELPDFEVRRAYLTAELNRQESAVTENMIMSIAKRSVGWSLAELNIVVQNAVRASIGAGEERVTDGLFNEAFEKYTDGESKRYDEEQVKKTAYHEAGHAVVAVLLGITPSYTTVNARGNYGGYIYYADEDVTEYSHGDILARICIAMGGRASEVVFYNEKGVTSGARGDLKAATEYAMAIVCEYGMDEGFFMHVEREKRMELPGVTERVQTIIKAQYERALALIRENRSKVQAVVDALMRKNSLDDAELKALLENA